MIKMKLTLEIKKDKDGYYAHCKELEGCFTCGDSLSEVLSNIKESVLLYLEDLKKDA